MKNNKELFGGLLITGILAIIRLKSLHVVLIYLYGQSRKEMGQETS